MIRKNNDRENTTLVQCMHLILFVVCILNASSSDSLILVQPSFDSVSLEQLSVDSIPRAANQPSSGSLVSTQATHNPVIISSIIESGDVLELTFHKRYDIDTSIYLVDVNDLISITVEKHDELSTTTRVRPDGRISMNYIGEFRAKGLSVEQITNTLTRIINQKISYARVSVMVLEAGAKVEEFFKNLKSSDGGTTRTFTVRPDGKFSLPLLGEISAQGLSVSSLQQDLSKQYRTLLHYIDVTVNIKQRSQNKLVVLGEVLRPGLYSLDQPIGILQALGLAGDVTHVGNKKNIIIITSVNGNEFKKEIINVADMLKPETTPQQIMVSAGMIIYVPKRGIVEVDRVVDEYIRKLIPFSMNASISAGTYTDTRTK